MQRPEIEADAEMKEQIRETRSLFTGRNTAWMLAASMLCGLIIMLAMTGTDALCSSVLFFSGYPAITSETLAPFFRTWYGYAALAITELVLILTVAVLLNLLILLAEDLRHRNPVHPVSLVKRSVRTLRLFCCRQGIPVILYEMVVIPALAITVFFVVPNPFEFPGFVLYVIRTRAVYRTAYLIGMGILAAIQFGRVFLLYDVVLEKAPLPGARERSRRLVRENRRKVYGTLAGAICLAALMIAAGRGIFYYLPMGVQFLVHPAPHMAARFLVLCATYAGLLVLILCVFLAPWIVLLSMEGLFEHLSGTEETQSREAAEPLEASTLRESGTPLEASARRGSGTPLEASARRGSGRKIKQITAVGTLAVLAIVSWVSMVQFEYLFPKARNIEAVVHRLGGDLDVENTLEGQAAALEMGAEAAETDIQRTKDGAYVIFHDGTLERMCGRSERVCDLTLEELRAIEMTTVTGEVRKIPTLEEVLDQAKGREKLFLELKGITADPQMADDVIALLREKEMEQDCVLISMRYNVIRYIDQNYPDITCGYLYFFAYGNESRMEADLLMSQSNVINLAKTRAIHRAGKQLYCWTVNSRRTCRSMIRGRVDGIISDRYDIIASVLEQMESRTDYERIMDVLAG